MGNFERHALHHTVRTGTVTHGRGEFHSIPLYYTVSMQLSEDSTQLREQMFAAAQFAMGRGVSGLGTAAAWLNGLLISAEEGLMWQQLIQYNLQVEQQRLQVRAALLRIELSHTNIVYTEAK